MGPILFPFQSSFYFLSLRAGATLVAAADGLISLVRMTLVLNNMEMFKDEFRFLYICESKPRFGVLFGVNTVACLLLGIGIVTRYRHACPVLLVPWLVMFLCSTCLYYPNIMYHYKLPVPITICLFIMLVCLYCWLVILSFLIEVLKYLASQMRPCKLTSRAVGVDFTGSSLSSNK